MSRSDTVPEAFLTTVLEIWGERGEQVACVLEGDCMAPWLRAGDELIIRPGAQGLRCGDVVLIRSSRGRLVERIVRVRWRDGGATYVVKPDRRYEFHPIVANQDILGKVVAVRGRGGTRSLETNRWRVLNRVLAWRSYTSGKCWQADTWFWKLGAAVAGLWRRLRTQQSPMPSQQGRDAGRLEGRS